MPKFNVDKISKLKKVDAALKTAYLFPRNKKKLQQLLKADVTQIVVLGFLLIGDTVMYIPALKILRRNFPNAKITLVCGKAVKIILDGQGLVDDYVTVNCPWISPFDKSFKNVRDFFFSLRLVNKKKYDIAIDFRGDWRNIFYLNFVKSVRKISFDFSGGEYMLTQAVHVDYNIEHLIDETLTLLKCMGCDFDEQEDKYPELKLLPADNEYLQNFIEENGLQNKIVIGIHPGASLEERRWNEQKYGEMIARVAVNVPNAFFILFEGPNEKPSIDKIKNTFAGRSVSYLVVNRAMHQYMVLLNSCHLMVCNDSGAAHLAAAYNIPEVVIFGKGDPTEVRPYTRNISKLVSYQLECKPCHMISCKFGTNLCMNMVTVDDVYNPVMEIIQTINTPNK